MPTSATAWKGLERRIARRFGVERHAKTGLGDATPDVIAPVRFRKCAIISVEVKLRGSVPKGITKGLEQSIKNTKKRHLPVLIMKEKNKKDDDAVVVMKLKDFCKYIVKVE